VNSTVTWFISMETCGAETTRSSSSVLGCSGSYIERMRSETKVSTGYGVGYKKAVPNISSWSIASTSSVSSSDWFASSIHSECTDASTLRPELFEVEKTTGFGLNISPAMDVYVMSQGPKWHCKSQVTRIYSVASE